MTVGDRRDCGTALCHRLAARVADIAPEGIGSWDPAWDIVGGPDAEFMLALSLWESGPGRGHEGESEGGVPRGPGRLATGRGRVRAAGRAMTIPFARLAAQDDNNWCRCPGA